jgi:hypothetical protein
MSNYHPHTHDEEIPRFEPWLAVMASSLVPPVVALYLRGRFFLPLVVLTVVLFLASLVMLRRQTVRRRVEQMHRSPEGRAGARSVAGDGLRMEGAEP